MTGQSIDIITECESLGCLGRSLSVCHGTMGKALWFLQGVLLLMDALPVLCWVQGNQIWLTPTVIRKTTPALHFGWTVVNSRLHGRREPFYLSRGMLNLEAILSKCHLLCSISLPSFCVTVQVQLFALCHFESTWILLRKRIVSLCTSPCSKF